MGPGHEPKVAPGEVVTPSAGVNQTVIVGTAANSDDGTRAFAAEKLFERFGVTVSTESPDAVIERLSNKVGRDCGGHDEPYQYQFTDLVDELLARTPKAECPALLAAAKRHGGYITKPTVRKTYDPEHNEMI